jgi:hypothetical protein
MNGRSVIQGAVYLVAGGLMFATIFGLFALSAWGITVHPLTVIALIGCLVLIAAGILSLFSDRHHGRILAVCASIGIMPIWFVWIMSLVPQHNVIASPVAYVFVFTYAVTLSVTLFFPSRLKFAISAFVIICGLAFGSAAFTYIKRVQQGEYRRAGVACFQWYPTPVNALIVERDPLGWIDTRARKMLDQAEIRGTLMWTGSSGEYSSPNRALVIVKGKLGDSAQLHYPRHGDVIYAFDGTHWRTFPRDVQLYSLCFSLETQDGHTMLYEPNGDSKQGVEVFQ